MKEKTFPQNLNADGLVQRLETSFRDRGYEVQTLRGNQKEIYVQMRKASTGRKIVGLDRALTVLIDQNGGPTRIGVGQADWATKTAVGVIGAIAFWPLIVSAGYGLYKQGTLPGKVWNVIDDYAASQNARPAQESTTEDVSCPQCGVTNNSESNFCSACGSPLKTRQQENKTEIVQAEAR